MTMKLPRAGREFAHWTVDSTDTLTSFQVQLTPTSSWVNATYANSVVSLLVKGPDFVDSLNDGLGTLVAANCQPAVRCVDTPEVVERTTEQWIELV